MRTIVMLLVLLALSAGTAAAGHGPGGYRADAVPALQGGETGNG